MSKVFHFFWGGLFLYYALITSPLHTYLQVVNFLSNLYLPFTQKTRNTTFIFISFIDFKKQSLCIVQEQFGILVQIKDMSYEISDEFNMILEYIWKLSKKSMVTLQWLKTQIMNYFNTGRVLDWLVQCQDGCAIFIQIWTLLKTLLITNISKLYISTLNTCISNLYVNSDQSRMRSFQPETTYSYQVKNN